MSLEVVEAFLQKAKSSGVGRNKEQHLQRYGGSMVQLGNLEECDLAGALG